MKLLVIALAALILLGLVYLFFSVVTVTVHFRHVKGNDQLTVEMKALHGLFAKKLSIPVIEAQPASVKVKGYAENENSGKAKGADDRITIEQVKNQIQKLHDVIGQFHGMRPIMKRFAKKIKVSKFSLHTVFGTGEAASTGKLTGFVWTVVGFIRMLLSFLTVSCSPDITVSPQFNRMAMEVELDCIFRFRVGQAILTACKLLYYWRGHRSSQGLFHKEKQTQQSENEIT